jgi:hypothetical protein
MKLSKRVPSNIAGAIEEEVSFRHESEATLFKSGASPFMTLAGNRFTPLENPAACPVHPAYRQAGMRCRACNGDEDEFFLKQTRGLMLRVSLPVRRARSFNGVYRGRHGL